MLRHDSAPYFVRDIKVEFVLAMTHAALLALEAA
jgi:hypothetical protein